MVEVVAVRSPFFSQGDQYWSCLARPGCSGPMGEGAVRSGHTAACIVASVNPQIEDGYLHCPHCEGCHVHCMNVASLA